MRNYLTNRRDNTFDLFDDVFDTFFQPVLYTGRNSHIRADIKENEKEYEFSVDLPGFDKKDIELSLSNGYLTVNAKKQEKEMDNEKFIRRERSMSCSRSFYVGEVAGEEDIKAKYNNGTLVLTIPKLDKKELPKKNIQKQKVSIDFLAGADQCLCAYTHT